MAVGRGIVLQTIGERRLIPRRTHLRTRSGPAFYMVLTLITVTGLLQGCATQSATNREESQASSPAAAESSGIVDKVVIPTTEVLGEQPVEPESEDSQSGQQPAGQDSTIDDSTDQVPEPLLSYRIGPGDILSLRSFDDEKLSMDAPVRYDGFISLQVIPDTYVEGMTREEAEECVREAYSEYYMDPELTLTISEIRSKLFTVLGEVQSPSEYPYTRPISVLNAIVIAGGPRINQQAGDNYVGRQGQLVKAFLVRNTAEGRQVFEYDLRGYQEEGPNEADSPVYPGDVVYVPESANLVYVLGEVRQPSVYAISEGLTLLNLLSLAGGYNESTARLREVAITREVSDTETMIITFDVRAALKGGTDFLLEPGDIIYVPRKRLVNAQEFIQRVLAPASTGMSFAQQVMSLYQQAYATYYTKEQFDRIYNNDTNSWAPLQSSLQQTTLSLQGLLNSATQLVPPVTNIGTP